MPSKLMALKGHHSYVGNNRATVAHVAQQYGQGFKEVGLVANKSTLTIGFTFFDIFCGIFSILRDKLICAMVILLIVACFGSTLGGDEELLFTQETESVSSSVEVSESVVHVSRAHILTPSEQFRYDVFLNEADRLEISCTADDAVRGLQTLTDFVVDLESSGERYAVSSSGALSYTQFKPLYKGTFEGGPIDTALNRLARYESTYDIEQSVIVRSTLEADHSSFMDVPLAAQQAFVIVNFAMEYGNDHDLALAACGDRDAAIRLYVEKHHRVPKAEPALWKNIEGKISKFYPEQTQLVASVTTNDSKESQLASF